ncbi:LamG-like jellyroll fold domain-containing protein [Flavobacterium sp. WC2509]|uniref:LamG-like jellyroll fold domain-containing protein n=1 Tax=Flavobacterium sp. WC2509 TaxID=3461406 RepID=UPI0040440730
MNLVNPYLFGKSLNQKFTSYYKMDFTGDPNSTNESVVGTAGGTLLGGVTYATGKLGDCVGFNVDNSRMIATYAGDFFSFTTGSGNDMSFSIVMWVKVSALSSIGNWLVTKRGNTTSTDEWQFILLNSGQLAFAKFDQSNNSIYQSVATSNPVVTSLNTWYHIAYTDNGSKTALGGNFYVNGVKVPVIDNSSGIYTGMEIKPTILAVGAAIWDSDNTDLKHRGYIDELGFCKGYELTQAEIDIIYNSGSGNTYPF